MAVPVGIDLGTGFCLVAVQRCGTGTVDVIANDSGDRSTPCTVGLTDAAGKHCVGDGATELPTSETIYDVKRLLGRSFTDPEIKEGVKRWPFIVKEVAGSLAVQVRGVDSRTFTPEELASYILSEVKRSAEFRLREVKKAVLTVPCYFSERQQSALRESARIAGLEVVALLPEPKAAVLAFGLHPRARELKGTGTGTVLVLHMGAGTCEASVLRNHASDLTLIASKADQHLGGNHMTDELVQHALKDIKDRYGVDAAADGHFVQELSEHCLKLKHKLSNRHEGQLSVMLPSASGAAAQSYKAKVKRAELNDMCAGLLRRVLDLCEAVLQEAEVELEQVSDVVLAGGATRMPHLHALLKQKFRSQKLWSSTIPQEVLAQGAARHAAALCEVGVVGRQVRLRDQEHGDVLESVPVQESATQQMTTNRDRHSQGEGPPVGFDLGTTFSAVAVHRRGHVQVLANDFGDRTTPSVVGFDQGVRYVGKAAIDLPATQQVFDAKRLIGRTFKDPQIQADIQRWPFTVVDNLGAPRFQVNINGKDEKFSPEEISSMVLSAMKDTAEDRLCCSVKKAVITVPAYFNETQRQATRDAGVIAGLEILAIINEPTAACMAYGLNNSRAEERIVLVFDLGGGTFDVSVMRILGSEFRVLASGGDTHLGGQDFNMRLMDHFMRDILERHPDVQLNGNPQALQDLRAACELIKLKLTNIAETSTFVGFPRQGVTYKASASRALFEDLCMDLFQKSIDIMRNVIRDAKLEMSAIHDVVLVGGSTRIPKVRDMLRTAFGSDKVLRHTINPDEAVAYGAAVHAAAVGGDRVLANQVVLRDVTSLSLGVARLGDIFDVLVPRNSLIPCRKTKDFHPAVDYQVEQVVEVFQGERQFAKDNHFLKYFHIQTPKKKWTEVTLAVTFDIDANGLLTVTCVETSTGVSQTVTITPNEARLNEEEIQQMIKNSLRFRDQDKQQKDEVQRLVNANQLL